jgi:hypothetical protein
MFRSIGRHTIAQHVIRVSFFVIIFYLFYNISLIGTKGAASLLLIITILSFSIFWLPLRNIVKYRVRAPALVLIIFLSWIVIRLTLDIADLSVISALLLGSSGGIILFYIIGVIFSIYYQYLYQRGPGNSYNYINYFGFIIALATLFIILGSRIRGDIFLLTEISGDYQRPGNFLSIYFIIFSYLFALIHTTLIAKKGSAIWIGINIATYVITFVASILLSQLIQSNSATAVILGIGLITIILSTLKALPHCNTINNYPHFKSKYLYKHVVKIIVVSVVLISILLIFLSNYTNFSIFDLNLFSFGDMKISSLSSRQALYQKYGTAQMAHAPFWGDYNVSRIVVGTAGHYIHSLFPNVISKLGIIGLMLVIALLLISIIENSRSKFSSQQPMHTIQTTILRLLNIYFLLYIYFVANLTADLSWSILWFTTGIASRGFSIDIDNRKQAAHG